MLRSLLTAASGMKAQQMQVDTIANNIANANTTGFKKNRLSFQSLYYQTYRNQGAPLGGGAIDATGLQVGSGTEISGSAMMMEQGQIEQTGNFFDVAIQGPGFFEIQMPNGELRYTRDGSFRRNLNGELVTAQGAYFEPARHVAERGDGGFDLREWCGELSGRRGRNVLAGELQVFRFPNPTGLRAEVRQTSVGQREFRCGGRFGSRPERRGHLATGCAGAFERHHGRRARPA
ncbi:MAG: flagellar hook-basal body complex protein [Planctomycetota bacterium]